MNDKLPCECERFRLLMDEEHLSEEENAFADAHIKSCAACAEQMRIHEKMLEALHGLDDGVVVPVDVQASWRRAVRQESYRRKYKNFSRWAVGIAAALIVFVGTTFALRDTTLVHPEYAPSQKKAVEDTYVGRRIYMPAQNIVTMAAKAAPFAVEPDGGMDEAAAVEHEEMAEEGSDFVVNDSAPAMQEAAYADEEAFDLTETPVSVSEEEDMLVHSAERVATVKKFEQERINLSALVDEYEGYFVSDTVQNTGEGAQRMALSVIRVPVALKDEFLTALDNIGETVTLQVKNESVAEYYYDAQSRLNAKRAIVDQLMKLIPESGVDEIEKIESRLEETYGQIDELERLVNGYSEEAMYATVTNTLYEGTLVGSGVVPAATKEPTLVERSTSGFRQSMDAVVGFLEDMIVSIAVILPVVIVIAVVAMVVFAVVWVVRRGKNKNENDE